MKTTQVVATARDEVLRVIGRSRERVWLASPFLSASIARAIVDRAPKGTRVDRRLLTAVTQRSIEAGVLDVSGLRLLHQAGWIVRSIPNLHAKAVVADGREALVGSANLTESGLGGGNLELGTWLALDNVDDALRFLEEWWRKATNVTSSDIEVASGFRARGRGTAGWVVGEAVNVQQGQKLGATRRIRAATSQRAWLKAMYHGGRNAPPDWWVHQPWINDAHGRNADGSIRFTLAGTPARRPTYQQGDFVVLYLVGPRVLPAIYEVTSAPRFDVDFVKAHWPEDAGTYGWVTDVELVMRAEMEKAPLLAQTDIPGQALQGGRKRLSDSEFAHIRDLIEAAS